MAYTVQTDPTAVYGRRVLAALIDAALILVPVIMLVTSQFEYHEEDGLTVNGEPATGEEFCDVFLDQEGGFCVSGIDDRVYFNDGGAGPGTGLFWAATFGLFVVLQGFTGWTIGKLVTGVRVVREDGRPPGFVKALVRWLLWVADGFPYIVPLVGFIVGLTTPGHRRVGDMVAKTFVVRASAAGAPIVVPGLTTAPAAPVGTWGAVAPTGPAGPGWGAAPPTDPAVPGWAAPQAPPAPPSAAPAAPPAAHAPQWDEARGTYIQWDPTQNAWMQWSEALKTWSRIPGQ